MRFNDAITGVVLVIFALVEIAYTRTFPSLHGQNYGPNLFPILIGCGLIGCGSILIYRGLMSRRTGSGNGGWADFGTWGSNRDARLNLALVLLSLLAYIFFSTAIGFIPISLLIISLLMFRLGSSILISITAAVVATTIIQLLFAKVLLVPLPAGLLRGFVW